MMAVCLITNCNNKAPSDEPLCSRHRGDHTAMREAVGPPHKKPLETEVLERTRRIETRLTQLLIGLGIDTHAQKPVFVVGAPGSAARLRLTSPHCSMKEMLDNIPAAWDGPVEVLVGDEVVATLGRP